MVSARNAAIAPIHPTDEVMCKSRTSLRSARRMVTRNSRAGLVTHRLVLEWPRPSHESVHEHDGDPQQQKDEADAEHLYPPGGVGRGTGIALFKDGLGHSSAPSRQCVTIKSLCHICDEVYTTAVPKVWTETIATHRQEVRDAI